MMDAERSRMQHRSEEEVVEGWTKKQEVIQEQLGVIQKISWRQMQLTPAQGLGTGQTGLTEVTQTTGLVQVIAPHRVIKVPVGIVRLPNPESQEKLQGLSHMDLVISQMSTKVLQSLHTWDYAGITPSHRYCRHKNRKGGGRERGTAETIQHWHYRKSAQ
jgi:hypothetical protein